MTTRLLLVLSLTLGLAACATRTDPSADGPQAPETPQQARQQQPQPAPSSVPQLYTVYFNFDSAALNEDTQPIIKEAAANAKLVRPVRIEIAGYTGLEADARTDDRLAAQRFNTVEQALVAEGLDRSLFARKAIEDPIPLPATAVRRIEIRFISQAAP
jgi:outer membrane protein OmpA-like peptidoglycan-associated protein